MSSNAINHQALLAALMPVARAAGEAIMQVYHGRCDTGAGFDRKADGSPVTEADRRAEEIILAGLQRHAPAIPVVSEENAASHGLAPTERYFLVDPLDGTREFIRSDGKGSFTVNIALIEHAVPAFGIVFAPALGRMFCGITATGAFEGKVPIRVRPVPASGPVAVASHSHRDVQTNKWLQDKGISDTVSIGSSLKFCLLACGEADVYPRFSPTMEWDTAAGHAVLAAAGGRVTHPDGEAFTYGKTAWRNGPFIARTD